MVSLEGLRKLDRSDFLFAAFNLLTRSHSDLRKSVTVSFHSACFQSVTNFAKALSERLLNTPYKKDA